MMAAFDPDGLIWIVVGLFRLLVGLVRMGASAVGTVVIILVGCAIAYYAVAVVRQWMAGGEVPRELPDATAASGSVTKDAG